MTISDTIVVIVFFCACRAMNISYITGSNGFLGSHLMNFYDENLFHIPHQKIQETDILPFENFFFLSSYGNMWGQDDIDETVRANTVDLILMLQKAVQFKFKSFIYISSSSVKLDNQTAYSRSKNASEQILLAYMEKYNLPICILRPFSITGVGEQKEHLIPKLIRSCFTKENMPFTPDATHDFIDVDDVVLAIDTASKRSLKGIFEVGSGKKYKNSEVLSLVEKITRKKANVTYTSSMRPYDNKGWFSTNYKMRSWGWMPNKTLEQSIREMVKAYDLQE